jgi:hypothetical protein
MGIPMPTGMGLLKLLQDVGPQDSWLDVDAGAGANASRGSSRASTPALAAGRGNVRHGGQQRRRQQHGASDGGGVAGTAAAAVLAKQRKPPLLAALTSCVV